MIKQKQEETEALLRELRQNLIAELNEEGDLSDEEILIRIEQLLEGCGTGSRRLTIEERLKLSGELFSSIRKLDILQELVDDPACTEIMVNGPDRIFFEKEGRMCLWDRSFASPEKLDDVVQQIAGKCNRVINERQPVVDARLSDGSRVNAVIAPVALNGPILTIRKFPDRPITMKKLIDYGTISEEAALLLQTLVGAGYSVIIGGGTSAGKTTFLNALSDAIPKEERIITIEDNAELQIRGIPNLVRLEAKAKNQEDAAEVTIRDLIRAALRMRPNRIVIGEIRGAEALDMLQAFNTGHDGSLCTVHANSCLDMLSRIETMTLMAFPLPLEAIRRQIASGADILVHLGRLKDRRRHVLEISELDGINDSGWINLRTLYRFDDETGMLKKEGELRHTGKLLRYGS
jgi:pilus assembly protein CpaF